jgi:exopolysaccharide production protein ExoQ
MPDIPLRRHSIPTHFGFTTAMKAQLSILICLAFIIWLWRRDLQARSSFSKALWIPTLWLLVLGSRPLSFWLGVRGSGSLLEGNAFDATLYAIQIFASVYVLTRRGIQWNCILQRNRAVVLFYIFLLASVLWAPYSFVAFKRWFKDFGAIPVMLIFLTEEDPLEAIKAVFARCAYVLFPLSVVLVKYFPSVGRQFSHRDVMFTGVTVHKNSLGEIIVVFGLVILAEAIHLEWRRGAWLKGHTLTLLCTLATGVYLLVVSNSKTSLICFIIGALILMGQILPFFKGHPYRVLVFFLLGVPLFFLADYMFHLSDYLLQLIHRDPTFTERTDIWEAVKQNPVNPITGTGYMMYWQLYTVQLQNSELALRTAHNGYLDIYLDGGLLGLFFLGIMLLAVGFRAVRELLAGFEYGSLVFAFYVVMLLHNISESSYARRSPLWFAFLLFAFEFRGCLRPILFEEANLASDSWSTDHESQFVVRDRSFETAIQ